MKKIYSICLFTIATLCMKGVTSYTVNISGFTYAPASLTVAVGDVVTIMATGNHPLLEVSQTTWNSNGNTALSGGFGPVTTAYTFTVTSTNTIYYVCQNHAGSGMKGQINVASVSTGITENSNVLSNISLFPNPAKGNKFSMKFNTIEKVNVMAKLYSISGQEVETLIENKEFVSGTNTVNVELKENTPAGVYFVQFTSNTFKVVKKLIIY